MINRRHPLVLSALLYSLNALALSVSAATVLPYETDFEAPDFTPGILVSDPDWAFDSDALTVEVIDTDSVSPDEANPGLQSLTNPGVQSLTLVGTDDFTLDAEDAGVGQIRWVDFYVKPVFVAETDLAFSIGSYQSAVTGFVIDGSAGQVYAVDGDGTGSGEWVSAEVPIALAGETSQGWVRLAYRIDYASKRWDLYIDNQLVLVNLGFLDDDFEQLNKVAVSADETRATGVDHFYVGPNSQVDIDLDDDGLPEVDSDNDGMMDIYEVANGLNVFVDDRIGDADKDSLSNIQEYFSGLLAGTSDSDFDGVHDGQELRMGNDPVIADSYSLNSIPFSADFEAEALGSIDGVNLWSVESGSAVVQTSEVASGAKAVELAATTEDAVLSNNFDGSAYAQVWVDFQIKPVFWGSGDGPDVADFLYAPLGVFYFNQDNTVTYLNGDGQGSGTWESTSVELAADQWQRVTLHNDYEAQTWSLWINSVRVAQDIGFAHPQPYFNHLAFQQGDEASAYLDDLTAANSEPAALDNDGDTLPNTFERDYNLNPDDAIDGGTVDSDRDGQTNFAEYQAGSDPLDYYNGETPLRVVFNADEPDATYGDFLAESTAIDGDGNVVFSEVGHSGVRWSSDLIPVDVTKSYRIAGRFQSQGTLESNIYFGLSPYETLDDGTSRFITSQDVIAVGDIGYITGWTDTAITTSNILEGWNNSDSSAAFRQLGIYFDGDTSKRPDVLIGTNSQEGYSSVSGTQISIPSPLDSTVTAQINEDTVIRNHRPGAGHMYTATRGNKTVPHEWTTYSCEDLSGEAMGNGYYTFRDGTEAVKLLLLANYNQTDDEILEFDDLIFEEIVNIDGDVLPDWFEENIVRADPNDALINPGFVEPWDDFDDDGITNEEEYDLELDPIVANLGTLPFFEDFESYSFFSAIYGQNLWITRRGDALLRGIQVHAGAKALELAEDDLLVQRSFDAEGASIVTTRFHLQPNPRSEIEAPVLEPDSTAVFFFGEDGLLQAYNGSTQTWQVLSHAPIDFEQWQKLSVTLDYTNQSWSLVLNDQLVAADLGFAHAKSEFKRFALIADGDTAQYLDTLSVLPADLEDGDALPETWEQAIVDASTTDALLTTWDVLGVDPGDGTPSLYWDFDGDGTDNATEYAQGRLATVDDSDVDLYVTTTGADTYTGRSAVAGKPTANDGPKQTIAAALTETTDDGDIILLESGTYDESTLSLNGKNRTLRLNGPVTIH